MTGLRGAHLGRDRRIRVGGQVLSHARTFAEVSAGAPFWYENALGLVELAVNQDSAARLLGVGPGDPIEVRSGP